MVSDDEWNTEPIIWQANFIDWVAKPLTIDHRQIFYPVIYEFYFTKKEDADEWMMAQRLRNINRW